MLRLSGLKVQGLGVSGSRISFRGLELSALGFTGFRGFRGQG